MSLNNCCVSAPTVINVSTLTSSSCLTEVYRAVHAVEGVACNLDGLVGDVFKQQSFRKPCDTVVQAIVTCNMGLIVASLGCRLSTPLLPSVTSPLSSPLSGFVCLYTCR